MCPPAAPTCTLAGPAGVAYPEAADLVTARRASKFRRYLGTAVRVGMPILGGYVLWYGFSHPDPEGGVPTGLPPEFQVGGGAGAGAALRWLRCC